MNRQAGLFFILCLLFTQPSIALPTVIEGDAPAFPGKIIRLSTYSDMITNRHELLCQSTIDKDGHFLLQTDVKDTLSYIISIGFRKSAIFLVPGKHYLCEIQVNQETLQQQRLPSIMQELPFRFTQLSENDPNSIIPRFTVSFENFLTTNANAIRSMNKTIVLDSLQHFRQLFTAKQGSFADIYFTYKTADLVCMMHRWNDRVIFENFLKNKSVWYNHPAYMDFFNIFFEHYFTQKSASIKGGDLDEAINKSIDLHLLTDNIGKDSVLKNERIRELALLKNLGELYYNPEFQSQNILDLISQIGITSKYPEHRKIASNLIFSLTQLKKGSPAPVISFIDQNGILRTSGDFRGKWLYLGYFTTWCENCTAGMKILTSIKKQFGKSMEIVSVCCNDNALDLKYFLEENKEYNWIFTNMGDSITMVEAYQVMAYPFYVLIDPEGNIFQYPARNPENQLREYLEALIPENPGSEKK